MPFVKFYVDRHNTNTRRVAVYAGTHCNIGSTRYDTIRYDIDLRALKSWRDGQLNLAHGPETKNNGKNKYQKPSSSEETVREKSVEAVREEEE